MHHSLEEQWIPAAECPQVIESVESFVAQAFTRENVMQHKAYVYTNRWGRDDRFSANAFAIHYPGSSETEDLPGFTLDELPDDLAELTRRACAAMNIKSGRVFLNVARYSANSRDLEPHFDGEFFDFTVVAGESMIIRRGVQPSRVGVLTLLNNAVAGGTRLHPQNGDAPFVVDAKAGDLLQFSNLHYQHGAAAFTSATDKDDDSWHRFIIGWRAFEDDCYSLNDNALSPVSVAEAAQLHRDFLRDEWPGKVEGEVEAMGDVVPV